MAETRAQPVSKTRTALPKFSDQELYFLAEKFGTPYFLIDEATLRKNVTEIEQAYQDFKGPFRVAYSMKANFNPSVIRTFVSEGIMFDLTSANELYFLQRCGGSTENVIYTSITETMAEYEQVLKLGVRKIVVSSHNGLLNLVEASARTGTLVDALVRINPEVHVKAELRGSVRHGKFGVPLDSANEDSALSLLKRILDTPSLVFDGFHFHLGSQIEDPSCYADALEKLEAFIMGARRELGDFKVRTIDMGGGLPTSYGRSVPTPRDFSGRLLGLLNSLTESLGDKFTLIVESGRYLSADSTVMLSRIVNTKKFGDLKYIYIDGGYNTLLDSALLKHEYPVEVIPAGTSTYPKTVLVGRLCDPLDVFPTSSRSKLGGAETGKLVIFRDAGAYSIVLNTPFHCQTKPYVLMRTTANNYVVVRKGQDVEELYAEEGGSLLIQS
jgi:diaminopimelate decarboxylase